MTAAAALARAEALGAHFRLAEGGRVRFTPGTAPAEVVAELRANRAEVAAILAARTASPGEHDTAEAAAMVEQYAAPPSPPPPTPDPLVCGLLRGFHFHHPPRAAPPRGEATIGAEKNDADG